VVIVVALVVVVDEANVVGAPFIKKTYIKKIFIK
jgi:hypothetical protein